MAAGGCAGGCHPVAQRAGPPDAAACDDGQLAEVTTGGRSPWMLGMSTRCGKRSTGCALEAAELRASRKRLVLAADADRRRIERSLHTRRAAASGRTRGQRAARAADCGRRSRGGERAPRRDGARRAAGAGRDGSARAADLRAAARGAALAAALRSAAIDGRDLASIEVAADARGLLARVRGDGATCAVSRRSSPPEPARGATLAGARRGRTRSTFEARRGRRHLRCGDSTGCATASRRSGGRLTIRPESRPAARASPARSRSRDDARPLSAR